MDRISDLPSGILDNILNYLPVGDAVRTSILSKKWRYQWVTIPHLVFDENFRKSIRKKKLLPEAITSHILSLHNGAITKFLVKDYHQFCSPHPRPSHQWLSILSDRHLEDLALSSYNNEMPLRLFDFKQLKHLYMEAFEISELPPMFQGFTSLVKLELLNFFIRDGRLGKFLSKCPVLEYLNLQGFNVIDGFMEELPKDLDRLTVLKLGNVRFENEQDASCILGLIKSSPNLRCLDITVGYHPFDKSDESNPDETEVVALEYLKAQLVHVHFSRLEDVKIIGIFCSFVEIEFIKILLLQAVALRTLKFEFESVFGISARQNMLKMLDKAPRASKFLNIIV